jgi:hypothetical protein
MLSDLIKYLQKRNQKDKLFILMIFEYKTVRNWDINKILYRSINRGFIKNSNV